MKCLCFVMVSQDIHVGNEVYRQYYWTVNRKMKPPGDLNSWSHCENFSPVWRSGLVTVNVAADDFQQTATGQKFNFLFELHVLHQVARCIKTKTVHNLELLWKTNTHPQSRRWAPRPKPPALLLVSIAMSISLLSSGLKGWPDFMMWLLYWAWSAFVAPLAIQSASVRFWPVAVSLAA